MSAFFFSIFFCLFSVLVDICTHPHYGHESWVMTEKVRSQMQASEMRFLQTIKGVAMFHKFRYTAIPKISQHRVASYPDQKISAWMICHVRRLPQERLPSKL